jgi:hypothetical protein
VLFPPAATLLLLSPFLPTSGNISGNSHGKLWCRWDATIETCLNFNLLWAWAQDHLVIDVATHSHCVELTQLTSPSLVFRISESLIAIPCSLPSLWDIPKASSEEVGQIPLSSSEALSTTSRVLFLTTGETSWLLQCD